MALSPEHERTREQFFIALAEATVPLKQGPDREVTLELLIEAAQMLRDHLEAELSELRQEETD